jgi:Family of unknown function (DUF5771)
MPRAKSKSRSKVKPRAKPKAKTVRKTKSKTKSRNIARSAKGKPIIPLDGDEHYLSDAGYAISKSEAVRRTALRKAINKKVRTDKMARPDAIRKTLKRVNVLKIYRKDQRPKKADRLDQDVKYLSRMLARENAKLVRAKGKSKSKSKSKRRTGTSKGKRSKSKSKAKGKRKVATRKGNARKK